MLQNFYALQMGATQITVGLSQTVTVTPMPNQNGGFFRYGSGGTLALVDGASSILSSGYVLGTTEVVRFYGPATFFLAAAGATTVVQYVPTFSATGGMSAFTL